MYGRVGEVELREDVGAGARVGGGGDGEAGHAGEQALQAAKGAVIRAEVMAPLADAVRLVHGDQRNVHVREPFGEAGAEAFGRDVEQIHLTALGCAERRAAGIEIHRAVEAFSAHADLFQRVHLVGHQRDQRRDDDPAAVAQQCRDLVAERLAAAGRQHREAVTPGEDIGDDILLQAAERVIAVDALQQRAGVLEGGGGRHRGVVRRCASRGKGRGAAPPVLPAFMQRLHECHRQGALPCETPATHMGCNSNPSDGGLR